MGTSLRCLHLWVWNIGKSLSWDIQASWGMYLSLSLWDLSRWSLQRVQGSKAKCQEEESQMKDVSFFNSLRNLRASLLFFSMGCSCPEPQLSFEET
jgi:hypothetical protein